MAFDTPLAAEIWASKYRFTPEDGAGDLGIEETWARVAAAIAEAEPNKTRRIWRERFSDALQDFQFLPAGRIVAGAGTARSVTLFNCFVMGDIPDNLSAIFGQLQEAARTIAQALLGPRPAATRYAQLAYKAQLMPLLGDPQAAVLPGATGQLARQPWRVHWQPEAEPLEHDEVELLTLGTLTKEPTHG